MQYNGLFSECCFEEGHGKILRIRDKKQKYKKKKKVQISNLTIQIFFSFLLLYITGTVHPSGTD